MSTLERKRKSLKHSFAQIGSSKAELIVTLVCHIAAIVAVTIAAIPFILKHLLIVALIIAMALRCHRWRSTPVKRWLYQNEQWYLSTQEHKETITACYYWSSFLLVLIAEGSSLWNRQYRLIFWDACSAEDFRHIKLVCRYGLRGL